MPRTTKDGGLIQRATGVDTVVRITPTLDTSAYAQNDILFAVTELPDALIGGGGTVCWMSLRAWEKTGSARAIRIMLLRSSTSVGAANASENIADTAGLEIVAEVDITSGDWIAYANFGAVEKRPVDLGQIVKPTSGTSLYAAGKYTDATGDTFAASDLVLEFGFSPAVS